jgi:8-oxo-dGTP pyrophosphatase MutT (NUDIX family)
MHSKQFEKIFENLNYCTKCGSKEIYPVSKNSLKCNNCDHNPFINPAVGVGAIIFNDKQELLLTIRKNNPQKGMYDFAGGFVEPFETAEKSIKREISEELNLDFLNPKILFTLHSFYVWSEITIPILDIFFEGEIKDFSKIKASDDVQSFEFVNLNTFDVEKIGLSGAKQAIIKLKKDL